MAKIISGVTVYQAYTHVGLRIYAPFIGGYSDFWLGRMGEDDISEEPKLKSCASAPNRRRTNGAVSRAEAAEILGVSTQYNRAAGGDR